MTITKTKTDYLVVALSYLGFIALGLPSGLLGAAWSPYIQQTFEQPLDALGLILVMTTIGYFITSFVCGQLIARFGVDKLMLFSSAGMALGILGYVIAPVWEVMVISALIYGLGSGALDTGLNIFFAANFSARLMNWLHACFGIGLTIGPLLLQAMLYFGLSNEQSWRVGYVVIASALILISLSIGLTLKRWFIRQPEVATVSAPAQLSIWGALRLPIIWISIAMFMVYAGFEGTPGQWLDDLFHQARGIPLDEAPYWISLYWGSFTIGRFLFGVIVDRIPVNTLLRTLMLILIISAALIWLNVGGAVNLIAVLVLGFAQAPIFALLVSDTPHRVGPENAANAISFQVAAASIGFAALPALAGILADDFGAGSLAPFFLVAAALMFILHEAVLLLSPKEQ
jgi:fucose permease